MALFRPSIATMSLGAPGLHDLDHKLRTAASHGFRGIELYWDDLHAFTLTTQGTTSHAAYLATATNLANTCASLDLTVVSLQPFRNFEGTLDPSARKAAIDEFALWLDVAAALGTDTIGVPSTIVAKGHTGDRDVLVADLREIALLAAAREPPICVAYENLCFGAFVRTWQAAYDLVEAVDMPNFGFLPDTFNMCVSAWADPASETGTVPDADAALRASLTEFRARARPERLFLLQVADGERLDAPIRPGHEFFVADQPARMSYSRNFRCFPLEARGYLPVRDVAAAVLDVGYRGWVSGEVFSRTTLAADAECVQRHAGRAWRAWGRLRLELHLNGVGGGSGGDGAVDDEDDSCESCGDAATLASCLSEAATEVDSTGEAETVDKEFD